MIRLLAAVVAAAIAAVPSVSHAVPVPQAVEAMIRTAAGSAEFDAVVKTAKASNPNSLAEIDALVASLKAEAAARREAELADAGLFDAWSGSGQLGFSRTTGNTRDLGLVAGLSFLKDGLRLRHKLNGMADRQKTSGVLTRSKYLADYELNYKFNDRLYAYGGVAWDKDAFAGIRRRLSESVGVGYSVLNTDTMKLDLSAGPSFRQTRYVTGRRSNQTVLKAAADFAWKFSDSFMLTEKAVMFFNSQFTSSTALTAALAGDLSARLSYDIDRQDEPLPGRKRTDTATRASLVYAF
jgi:putative salt-induced outer membrane protein